MGLQQTHNQYLNTRINRYVSIKIQPQITPLPSEHTTKSAKRIKQHKILSLNTYQNPSPKEDKKNRIITSTWTGSRVHTAYRIGIYLFKIYIYRQKKKFTSQLLDCYYE